MSDETPLPVGAPPPRVPPEQADPLEKGESLWVDAWRRLRRNRMAMGGLVVCVLASVVALGADFLTPFDPETQERWYGSVPPGTTHADLRSEVVLERGVVPRDLEVPAAVARVLGDGERHTLDIDVQVEKVSQVRLVLDRGRIERLELRPSEGGIQRPEAVEVGEDAFFRFEGERLEIPRVESGGPQPEEFGAGTGRRVVQFERVERRPEDRYQLTSVIGPSGAIAELRGAGAEGSADRVRLRAEDIAALRLDGEPISHTHVLGTDKEGRDTLSRVIFGARISMLVGVVATLVSLFIGVAYGSFSGFSGGKLDAIMMRVVDILFGLPFMFLVILLLTLFGRSLVLLFVALGAVEWLPIARIVRGQVLSLKEKEYVDAARTLGASELTILRRHVVPNTLGIVVVYTTLTVPLVIMTEAFLSFLGLQVEYQGRALESWGALIEYGRQSLGTNGERWWLLVVPATAMSVTIFSMNFLGDGLRDALDPQQRGRS